MSNRTLIRSFILLAITLFQPVTFRAFALPPNKPVGVQAQLGLGELAAGRLLQRFHLPASPSELIQFVLEYAIKQRIGNTLPLNLNANRVLPLVENAQIPGGAFRGEPLLLTEDRLLISLPPGDYLVPVMAFCTQYSVHRPGEGTAYKLAPIEGTEAEAIATLLWRGTLAGRSAQDLQATNWAIQSGVTYDRMPRAYQQLIDQGCS